MRSEFDTTNLAIDEELAHNQRICLQSTPNNPSRQAGGRY